MLDARERRLNYHVHDAISYLENEKYPDRDRVVLALATLKQALVEPKKREALDAEAE